jgi:STE24 endopeptidase
MRLARAAEIAQGAVVLLLTLGGGIAAIDAFWRSLVPDQPWLGTVCVVTVLAVLRGVMLPFLAWRVFVIEARFGFNRMSAGLFFEDFGKRLLLGTATSVPLAAGAVWLVGNGWWFALFVGWFVLSLAWTWARPALIAPLFNRFAPLTDSALEQRIAALLRRCGFAPDGVYVMDGSRRSAHLNASLSGFGRHKRIVFHDTLLGRLEPREIEAVLAHELGHFRLRHVRERLLITAALGFFGFLLLGWLSGQDTMFAMLGFAVPEAHALLAFALTAAGVCSFFATPFRAAQFRRQEFEADVFALMYVDVNALVDALQKIHRDNRADFAPDRIYTAFYATHPPLAERIARVKGG